MQITGTALLMGCWGLVLILTEGFEREGGQYGVIMLLNQVCSNGLLCKSSSSKRCVQGHQGICAKRNVFYGKLTPVKLNNLFKGKLQYLKLVLSAFCSVLVKEKMIGFGVYSTPDMKTNVAHCG